VEPAAGRHAFFDSLLEMHASKLTVLNTGLSTMIETNPISENFEMAFKHMANDKFQKAS
jgi:hypothetical protein